MADKNLDLEPDDSEEADNEKSGIEGDKGTLPLEIRSLLVTLLRGPFLVASEKPNLWKLLLDNKEAVLSQLANLNLTLLIDETGGIAFVKKLDLGDTEAPSLLTTISYKLLDSVLIVKLRETLMMAESAGQRASISFDEMSEVLKFYDPVASTDQVNFQKHVSAAVDRCCKRHFLTPLPNKGYYEINKIIKLLFTASDVAALAAAYEDLIRKNKKAPSED